MGEIRLEKNWRSGRPRVIGEGMRANEVDEVMGGEK